MTATTNSRHAIVIGGSIAGLLAARVLSERFERVTIIDRDYLGDAAEPRKGVPQGYQTHAILTRSWEMLRELFPGLLDAMVAEGASVYDSGLRMPAILNGCWVKPGVCELMYVDCTRPFYESRIRAAVRSLANVSVLERTVVTGIVPGADGGVTGIECEDAEGGKDHRRVDGDVVVDAAGRATHAPRWLAALGYGLPPVEEVRIDLTYVGALYEPPRGFHTANRLHVIYPDPPTSWHGGLLQPVEGGRWQVSQWGLFGDRAPLEDAGFIEFSRTLASEELYAFLRSATRLTELRPIGIPVNRWHRYDAMRAFPRNFICIGDAVSSLNPIYGQGMTKAAIHVMRLRQLLHEAPERGTLADLGERMRKDLPSLVEKQAWMTTVYGDLVYPQASGHRPSDFRFVTWYTRCLAELGSIDLEARTAYQRALILQDGMFAMFRPRMFAKVMAYAARRRFVSRRRRMNLGPMPSPD